MNKNIEIPMFGVKDQVGYVFGDMAEKRAAESK